MNSVVGEGRCARVSIRVSMRRAMGSSPRISAWVGSKVPGALACSASNASSTRSRLAWRSFRPIQKQCTPLACSWVCNCDISTVLPYPTGAITLTTLGGVSVDCARLSSSRVRTGRNMKLGGPGMAGGGEVSGSGEAIFRA